MTLIKLPFILFCLCIELCCCKTVKKKLPEPCVTNTLLPIYGPRGGCEPVGHLRWTEYDSQLSNIAVLLPLATEQEKKVLAMLAWVWKKFQHGGVKVLASVTALEDLPMFSQVQNFYEYLKELN